MQNYLPHEWRNIPFYVNGNFFNMFPNRQGWSESTKKLKTSQSKKLFWDPLIFFVNLKSNFVLLSRWSHNFNKVPLSCIKTNIENRYALRELYFYTPSFLLLEGESSNIFKVTQGNCNSAINAGKKELIAIPRSAWAER